MASLTISDYLKYANLQMAAEAFLYSDDGKPKPDVKQALIDGSGQKGDWLSGNGGNDTLVAGNDNDVLAGVAGSDLLIAGAGDDNIMGDTDYVASFFYEDTWRYRLDGSNWYHSSPTTFDWHFRDTDEGRLFEPVYGETYPAGAAADTIYAGAGKRQHRYAVVDQKKERKFKRQAEGGSLHVAANQFVWEIAS